MPYQTEITQKAFANAYNKIHHEGDTKGNGNDEARANDLQDRKRYQLGRIE